MGVYLNPTTISKEDFLFEYGDPLTEPPTAHVKDGKVAIVLVGNKGFTAAAVCYSQEELIRVSQKDHRPRVWFYVPIDQLSAYIRSFIQ